MVMISLGVRNPGAGAGHCHQSGHHPPHPERNLRAADLHQVRLNNTSDFHNVDPHHSLDLH
jgi:hypothetical protein